MVTQDLADGARLVVFDLCDTLYAANTTVGFLQYYSRIARKPEIAARVERWTSRRSPFFYLGAAFHRLGGLDLSRRRMIAGLAGEPRQQLESIARDYADQMLPALANAPLHERLAAHLSSGDRVIIVSSSLDLVVEPVANMLGAEYRASTLLWNGDICSGRLQCDLTGGKAEVVSELLAGRVNHLTVYTDNRSDQRLVDMADRAIIVIPKGVSTQHWAGEAHDYLTL